MSPWDRLLERPRCGHLVQFYERGDDSALISNVGLYLSEGLDDNESALTITSGEHRVLLLRELESLGVNTQTAIREKRLVCLDAQEILSRFLMSGWPDWNRFDSVVGGTVRSLKREEENTSLRAYGEMVDILWRSRQFNAALRLEQFWNKLLSRHSFSLYCAYAMELSGEKAPHSMVDDILSVHTHSVPNAVARARQPASAIPAD